MKIRNMILTGVCALAAMSCSYLDFDETSGANNKEAMYATFANIKNMLTHVYSYMPQYAGFSSTASVDGMAMRDCASDDAEYGITSATVQNVNNGNWSATNTYDDAWSLYGGIRAANAFIVDVENVDLSKFFTQGGAFQNQLKQLEYYPYEARVLRATHFFELARRYGDIAMPTEVLTIDEANSIGKTSFDDVIKFIVSECDECAVHLPVTFQVATLDNAVGRTTKGYALALKTKALLYAASPLHNPSNDTSRWEAVARAALEVINMKTDNADPEKVTPVYSLDPAGCFNKVTSSELILARMNLAASFYELYNFPRRFTYGQRSTSLIAAGNYPSQNLVDAFETENGYPVTLTANGWVCDDPKFDPENPYANRDPRFARTILADGMSFKGSTIAVYTDGEDDYTVPQGGSATGYFVRKYISDGANFDPEQTGAAASMHHWIIYRYAETLLSYAEAMVNAFGSGSYKNSEFTLSALDALNQVRANASMPDVEDGTKAELLAKIQNEWRVEFAFEDHRFWDIRRWKIGDQTTELAGVNIVRGTDGTKTYRRRTVENRTWREAMYLYPIPQSELFKNRNLYPQNPQW